MPKPIIIIGGATASGKTNFAIEFASKNNGSIINADSMQVYQEIPILSAQPSKKAQETASWRANWCVDTLVSRTLVL